MNGSEPIPARFDARLAVRIACGGLFAGSLIVTAATNRIAGRTLDAVAPEAGWIATAALPSCLLIGVLYAAFGRRDALRWPARPIDRRTFRLSAGWLLCWLAGSAMAAPLSGGWITYAEGPAALAAFLVFGPLGEELLFRGLVFQQVRQGWPHLPRFALYVSTVAFSLHHIALRAAPDSLMLAQILFTLPMGLVLAMLRDRTGSLWPGLLVHVATNLPATL